MGEGERNGRECTVIKILSCTVHVASRMNCE